MKKLFGAWNPEETRRFHAPIKKHDELKSFGRFWYQEIRDFLNSKRTVPEPPLVIFSFGPRVGI
jgi:hypothetical protein